MISDEPWTYSNNRWRPKGVTADECRAALDALPPHDKSKTPEVLAKAARPKSHRLHHYVYGESEAAAAWKWRVEKCRHLIANLQQVVVVGGKSIEVRAVEFIRTPSDVKGSWQRVEDIIADRELLAAYMLEVERMQEQAQAKVARVRILLQESD